MPSTIHYGAAYAILQPPSPCLSRCAYGSELEVLDHGYVGVDAFDECGVGGGVGEVGVEHLLGLDADALEVVAAVEVLLLGQCFEEVVDAVEAVLDLREVGLHVGALREGHCALADRPQLQRVRLPVVVPQLQHELFALVVVDLGGVEVHGHVAGDQVERGGVGVEGFHGLDGAHFVLDGGEVELVDLLLDLLVDDGQHVGRAQELLLDEGAQVLAEQLLSDWILLLGLLVEDALLLGFLEVVLVPLSHHGHLTGLGLAAAQDEARLFLLLGSRRRNHLLRNHCRPLHALVRRRRRRRRQDLVLGRRRKVYRGRGRRQVDYGLRRRKIDDWRRRRQVDWRRWRRRQVDWRRWRRKVDRRRRGRQVDGRRKVGRRRQVFRHSRVIEGWRLRQVQRRRRWWQIDWIEGWRWRKIGEVGWRRWRRECEWRQRGQEVERGRRRRRWRQVESAWEGGKRGRRRECARRGSRVNVHGVGVGPLAELLLEHGLGVHEALLVALDLLLLDLDWGGVALLAEEFLEHLLVLVEVLAVPLDLLLSGLGLLLLRLVHAQLLLALLDGVEQLLVHKYLIYHTPKLRINRHRSPPNQGWRHGWVMDG